MKISSSMAFTRQQFIQTLRDDFLKGAFGEFMCRQVALAVGKQDHWSNEVRLLLEQGRSLMDASTKAHFKDREGAAKEAVSDLRRILRSKVTYAKTKVANYYPKLMPQIQRIDFDPEFQFRAMLKEFLPEFERFLD